MSFCLLKQSLSPHLRVQNYEKIIPSSKFICKKIYKNLLNNWYPIRKIFKQINNIKHQTNEI